MILRLAMRSLLAHPIRSLVLSGGFGLGVGVMATLLGVGDVILDQARSPALTGGGDVVLGGAIGRIPAARWVLASALRSGALPDRVKAASPARSATLYLVRNGRRVPVRARGGIPSLERALGDPETAAVSEWIDADADRAWASPDRGEALAAIDRFHPIPDVPARADSWAEWLYFNGRAGDRRFYLTFLVGPVAQGTEGAVAQGTRAGVAQGFSPAGSPTANHAARTRTAGVRLQLEDAGTYTTYSMTTEVNEEEVLSTAPNLTIGSNRVRVRGTKYEVTVDLADERDGRLRAMRSGAQARTPAGSDRIRGTLVFDAAPGTTIPPLTFHGAAGWVSGYVVPIMSGALSGTLTLGSETMRFDGGSAYHDHNWGFWKDVSWRWGQVEHGDLAIVWGRIFPPPDAADPDRIPGSVLVFGRDGPIGYATDVTIEEQDDPKTRLPQKVKVTARGRSVDLTMDLDVGDAVVHRGHGAFFGGGLDFIQLRAQYRVRGRAGDRAVDFTARGSAETFRGR
jgi:hypothetical protein